VRWARVRYLKKLEVCDDGRWLKLEGCPEWRGKTYELEHRSERNEAVDSKRKSLDCRVKY